MESDPVIVGLYQCASPRGDLASAFAMVEDALSAAASAGAQMLVLPEIFLPGYGFAQKTPPEGWDGIADKLAGLCQRHKTALTIGLPEYAEDKVFNAAFAFSAQGEVLARYRKVQLFGPDEKALYEPGDSYATFDYLGRRFGLLICYDVEFAEHVRALAGLGAEVVLVPTANMMPCVNVSQILVPARAAENAVTIVYSNYCGTDGNLDYTGQSGIFGPDGYALAAKGQGSGLCIAELPSGWSEHGIPYATQIADFRPVNFNE